MGCLAFVFLRGVIKHENNGPTVIALALSFGSRSLKLLCKREGEASLQEPLEPESYLLMGKWHIVLCVLFVKDAFPLKKEWCITGQKQNTLNLP